MLTPPHQAALDQFNQKQIRNHRAPQKKKKHGWQRRESKDPGQRRKRQHDPNQNNQHGSDRQRQARSAAEGIAGGADHKEHQRLRGERFDKPAGVK